MISRNIIEEVKKRLVEALNPLEIYIFGSYAWGTPDEESDLDLLVVVDQIENDKQRHRALVEGFTVLSGLRISKDILLYSKAEFDEIASNVTTLCYKVKRQGKKIYAKTS